MRIGLLNNEIDERQTWQTYLYAKYLRAFLGHSPTILYPATRYANRFPRPKWSRRVRNRMPWSKNRKVEFNPRMAERFRRDGVPVQEVKLDGDFSQFDAVHHIKPGEKDGFIPRGTRYLVHAVYNGSQPHGDRYAAVSQWVGRLYGIPFVPHIVQVADDQKNLRAELGIPADAFVFGRFGGWNTFDIPWVWDGIGDTVQQFKNVYFLFTNTEMKLKHERIIGLPTIYDGEVSLEVQKRRFINTSNAMLHARKRGETFGIALGEFALCGRPVLTCGQSPERAHIDMLSQPLVYNDVTELKRLLARGAAGDLPVETGGAYREGTPEKVMQIFDQVFLQ